MAEEMDGEEFVVDKILDKRVRNGKIEYYLSWKVSYNNNTSSCMCMYFSDSGFWTRRKYLGAKRESRLSRADQGV